MKIWHANVFTLFSISSVMAHLEEALTIVLLLTAIVLNLKKFFEKNGKNKKDD